MSLRIGQAVEEGVGRIVERNALPVIAAAFVAQALYTVGYGSVFAEPIPFLDDAPTVGTDLGVVLLLVGWVGNLGVLLVAYRLFATEETATIPPALYSDGLVLAIVNLIIGSIVFSIVVGFGFILLIIPGIFLLVSLFFFAVYIAVEGRSFVGGLTGSWQLTKGHRFAVLGLVIAIILITALFLVPIAIVAAFLGTVGWLVAEALYAVSYVLIAAITARAYVQLERGHPAPGV